MSLALKDPHIKMSVFQTTLSYHPSQTRGEIPTVLFTSRILYEVLLYNELVLEVQPHIPVQRFNDLDAKEASSRLLNTVACARLMGFSFNSLTWSWVNLKAALYQQMRNKEDYKNHQSLHSRQNANTLPTVRAHTNSVTHKERLEIFAQRSSNINFAM